MSCRILKRDAAVRLVCGAGGWVGVIGASSVRAKALPQFVEALRAGGQSAQRFRGLSEGCNPSRAASL